MFRNWYAYVFPTKSISWLMINRSIFPNRPGEKQPKKPISLMVTDHKPKAQMLYFKSLNLAFGKIRLDI